MARKVTGSKKLFKQLAGIDKVNAYVGIPATSAAKRQQQLEELAGKTTSKKKKARIKKEAAKTDINNAELLFIFSKGSPVREQSPRPVLEPSVMADGNRQPIAREVGQSIKARLDGDSQGQIKYMKRAALAGQNAARGWFTDTRNNWAPNAPSTIKAKGSDRPGIDTSAMRSAIVGITKEDGEGEK